MKKKILLLTLFIAISVNSQQKKDSLQSINKWTIRAGFNTVDSNGDSNPFEDFMAFDEEAYRGIPVKLDIEYRLNSLFAFEVAGSINKWNAGEGVIDSKRLTKDQNYFAIDAGLKIYYDEALNFLSGSDWIELYLTGGAGYFKVNEGGISANLGTGATFWLSNHLGLNLNVTGKWAVDSEPALYDTNHIQYTLGLAYRFKDQDKDNDGIYDYNDNCPDIAGTKANNGCPDDGQIAEDKETATAEYDSDSDGVNDSVDKCPNIAGFATNNGCPILDSDKDGVIDSADNCPTIAGFATNNGCPILDSDKDGVIDSADNCPTIYGSASNNGCPLKNTTNSDETLNSMVKRIEFNTGNYNFRQDAYPALQFIVKYMKENPNSKYRIEGHTDSVGSYDSNRQLSKTRANAVKNYLVDGGIPETNLTTVGYGESKPIGSNLTKEGQARNRRIEIIEIK